MLALAGTVHHAAHHRHLHLFDAGVALLPVGHLIAQIVLDLIGHVLKEGAGGAAAAGHAVTCGVKWRRPRTCRICWETITSSVRSPFGSGVSEARMVSPMPSCNSTESAAVVATMPFDPRPASVSPRCSA